ncbi:MAG: hypothetical protein AB1Z38_10560 [Desulfotignum sp.]
MEKTNRAFCEEPVPDIYKTLRLSDGRAAFVAERTGVLTIFPGESAFG